MEYSQIANQRTEWWNGVWMRRMVSTIGVPTRSQLWTQAGEYPYALQEVAYGCGHPGFDFRNACPIAHICAQPGQDALAECRQWNMDIKLKLPTAFTKETEVKDSHLPPTYFLSVPYFTLGFGFCTTRACFNFTLPQRPCMHSRHLLFR